MATPELGYVPAGMATHAHCLSAGAGGMADVTAGLIQALYQEGADIHAAIPDYRTIFNQTTFIKPPLMDRSCDPFEKISMPCKNILISMNGCSGGPCSVLTPTNQNFAQWLW